MLNIANVLKLRSSMKFSAIKKFNYLKISNFATQAEKLPTLEGKPQHNNNLANKSERAIQPWVEVENRLAQLRGELVLSDHGKIEEYVIGVIRGYFRTTYKDGVRLDSLLSDHGLDSLDAIEIGTILEDELGYIIEAETLPQFTKVKHYANYIKQIEAYKKEHILLPQERARANDESWSDWIPFGEKLRSKLYGMTNEKTSKKENH
jgi:acyl carrier protein